MKLTANESGNEKLTVGRLADLLQGLPDDAVITNMTARNDQRDGDIWSFSVEWEPKPQVKTTRFGIPERERDDRSTASYLLDRD